MEIVASFVKLTKFTTALFRIADEDVFSNDDIVWQWDFSSNTIFSIKPDARETNEKWYALHTSSVVSLFQEEWESKPWW